MSNAAFTPRMSPHVKETLDDIVNELTLDNSLEACCLGITLAYQLGFEQGLAWAFAHLAPKTEKQHGPT